MCKALLPSAIEIATDLDRGQVNAEGRSLKAPHRRKSGMGGRVYQAGAHGPVSYKLITSKTENCFQTDYCKTENCFLIRRRPSLGCHLMDIENKKLGE